MLKYFVGSKPEVNNAYLVLCDTFGDGTHTSLVFEHDKMFSFKEAEKLVYALNYAAERGYQAAKSEIRLALGV